MSFPISPSNLLIPLTNHLFPHQQHFGLDQVCTCFLYPSSHSSLSFLKFLYWGFYDYRIFGKRRLASGLAHSNFHSVTGLTLPLVDAKLKVAFWSSLRPWCWRGKEELRPVVTVYSLGYKRWWVCVVEWIVYVSAALWGDMTMVQDKEPS